MKITSFYYIAYPDCSPEDPFFAESEVYIEVSNNDGSTNKFDFTYSVVVCTARFLGRYLETHPFYCGRSMIVIDRFDDMSIELALNEILQNIERFAIKK